MKTGAFLPGIVASHDREKPWSQWITGTVLFSDVSGFTPMSEALSALGAEGAEILTDILNRYFTRMIGIIHSHGGQVIKFGGDALLCFFPEEEFTAEAPRLRRDKNNIDSGSSAVSSLHAAVQMQEAMAQFQRIKTPVKKFGLQMKIGIASGEVLLAGVGDRTVRCDYVFAGRPVDLTSEAEHYARAGDTILAADSAPDGFDAERIYDGFLRIRHPAGGIQHPATSIRHPASTLARPYIIEEVFKMVEAGYHHQVGALQPAVSVFLQFTGFSYERNSFDLARFHEFFSLVMKATHRYEGRLNRVSMGDKGSTFLILFGAPKQIEKKEELAARWALEVRMNLRRLFPEIQLKAGMTTGRVYSGIVGGADRFEYTVMGDVVNLAARLMQGAEDNQICCSKEFEERVEQSILLRDLGSRSFKGKSQPLPVFALEGVREVHLQVEQSHVFVGREKELQEITQRLDAAAAEQPGMVLIEGEAGVGKSSLAGHILSHAQTARWAIHSTRSIAGGHGHSYAPWLPLLHNCFFPDRKPEIGDLLKLLRSAGEGFDANLSSHADFFGLEVSAPDLRASQFDEETRKNLLHHQLVVLLLQRLSDRPALLFLDDLHWFDSLSLAFLLALLNHLKSEKVLLLATTRPNWKRDEFANRSTCHFITLAEMDRAGVKALCSTVLNGAVQDSLVEFLYDQAKGNPFFTRQILDYLRVSNLLTVRLGEWKIARGAEVEHALSGEDVIIARFESLTPSEKSHLHTAACIGPRFSYSVLQTAAGTRFDPLSFESLHALGYFQNAGDGHFSFPHALVQETLYHAIPKRLRKRIHRDIGSAMESLFAFELPRHYPALARHFFEGGIRSSAINYCIGAGEAFYNSLSYTESLHFLRQAFTLLRSSKDDRKWRVGLTLAQTMNRSGKLKEGLVLSKRLGASVRRSGQSQMLWKFLTVQFDSMYKLGNYRFVPQALRLLKTAPPDEPSCDWIQHTVGAAFYRRGKFDLASYHLTAAIKRSSMGNDKTSALASYSVLAAIANQRGNLEEALKLLTENHELANGTGNFYQAIRIRVTRCAVLIDTKRLNEARDLALSLVKEAEALGDHYLVSVILANIGIAEIQLGNYQAAHNCLEECLALCSSLGARKEYADALTYKGMILYYQGMYQEAYEAYLEAAKLFEKLREVVQASWAHYNIAEVLVKLGRRQEAEQWHKHGLKLFDPKNDPQLARMYDDLRPQIFD